MAGKKRLSRIIPRDYGIVENASDRTPVFMTPSAFAIGEAIRLDARELNRMLLQWQDYKWRQMESSRAGRYLPDFPVENHIEYLSMRPECLRDDILIPSIVREEKTKNLWREGGKTAVERGYIGSRVVSGRVKTRSDGRSSERMRAWSTIMRIRSSVSGMSDFSDAYCQCEDHQWGRAKGVAKICVHIASLMNEVADEISSYSHDIINMWLPFDFVTGKGLPRCLSEMEIENLYRMGYIDNDETVESNLMLDILYSRYVMRKPYFDINKTATKIPHIFHESVLEGIKSGRLRYGVLQQKRGKKGNGYYWDAIESMRNEIADKLRENGFKNKRVTYPLEFRDTPYEVPCEEWTRDDISVRPLFHEDYPPLIVARKQNSSSMVNVFDTDYNARHPFAQLNEKQERIDDASRKRTSYLVKIPRGIDIPGILRPLYRKLIDTYYPGDKKLLKMDYNL